MTQLRIALVGISGVGKSTMLQDLKSDLSFQLIQASTLIKEASKGIPQDKLRELSIDENQKMLIDALKHAVEEDTKLVILDAHTVIDTPNGLVKIDSEVFRAAQIRSFIYLSDDPEAIEVRRIKDDARRRPLRSKEDLAYHQEIALLNAFDICLQLKIPMHVVTSEFSLEVARILRIITS